MASPTLDNSSYFPPSLPVAALKHAAHFCRSPKPPVPHLSCTWRLQNTGPGWCEGLTSLLGMGQHLCKAGLSCFEATEPLEEQVNAGASLQRALPRLWQHLRSRVFSRSAWETTPIATHTVCLAAAGCQISSSGMDFQAVAFIPLPPRSNLCLKGFSPLAPFYLQAWLSHRAAGRLWMHSNCFDLKFKRRVLCWEAFLLGRVKGNNWTFFILNHMIWHECLIPVVRCTAPNWVGCKAIVFLDGNRDLTFGSGPKRCQVWLALFKVKIGAEENSET